MIVSGGYVVVFGATPADTTFQLQLTADVSFTRCTGLQPGAVYSFDVQQDAVGGHAFSWPPNCRNFPPMPSQPHARVVQTAVCHANFNLLPLLPGQESFV